MKKGFTLLEVIVAIFIMIIGVVGVFVMVEKTASLSSVSSLRFQAALLAGEGIELVRNIRDSNWLEQHYKDPDSPDIPWDRGLTGCETGCEGDYNDTALSSYLDRYLRLNSGFYNYDSGENTRFKRKIIIQKPSPDILSVKVEVFWSDRGIPYSFSARADLYQWQ